MTSVFPTYGPGQVRVDGYADSQGLFGKKLLDVLGPFHDAEISAVQIFIQAYADSFRRVFYPIEIEVVHRLSVSAHVLVYNGESRGTDRIGDTQHIADGCSKSCFSCTHGGIECHKSVAGGFFQKFSCRPFQIRYVLDCYLLFHMFCVLVQKPSGQKLLTGRLYCAVGQD